MPSLWGFYSLANKRLPSWASCFPVGEHEGGCPELLSGLWVSQDIQPLLLLGSDLKLSFPNDPWALHVSILLWMGCLILKCTNFGLLKTSTFISLSLISLVSLNLS